MKENSFGGSKFDVVMDRNNFGLRKKKRQREGHAYMLVYVKESEYEKLVKLNQTEISYPENIKLFAEK